MSEPVHERFDRAWKRALDLFFGDLLGFLVPRLHAAIDWSHDVVFLDKELDALRPDSADGRRIADKLAKVRLRDGHELFVLILVEVQAQRDPTLAKRVFTVALRATEGQGLPIAPVVILADRSHRWRPAGLDLRIQGAGFRLDFATVKLLDFEPRIQELEASGNPIARVVAAHLRTLRTRAGPRTGGLQVRGGPWPAAPRVAAGADPRAPGGPRRADDIAGPGGSRGLG